MNMNALRKWFISSGMLILLGVIETGAQQRIDLAANPADMEIVGLSSFKKTGHALAVGDINGDALQDLIIGAAGVQTTERPKIGRVYVIFGKPGISGLLDLNFAAADVEIEATRPGAGLGNAVAAADLNGDGMDDIICSEPEAAANIGEGAGLVSIFWGRTHFSRAVADLDADVVIHGEMALKQFGSAMATGDFNNDGIADLIVGVPQASIPDRPSCGKIYILHGRTEWPAQIDLAATPADFAVVGPAGTQFIGNAVAMDDLNRDGRDDLIIGDFKANTAGGVDAGKTFILFGGENVPAQIDLAMTPANVTIAGGDQQDHFGFSLATGDFDGNGDADLMVGARRANDLTRTDVGKVFVFTGAEVWPKEIDLSVDAADFTLIGGPDPGNSGFVIATGEFDGDGKDDIVMGAPFASPDGRYHSGSVFVFSGRASTPEKVSLSADSSAAIVLGALPGHTLGNAVVAGDLNGDGMQEVVISAEDAAPAGRVYILSSAMITAIADEAQNNKLPGVLVLHQNYPNPFNAGTTIALDVPANAGEMEVTIFNLQGQKVTTLFHGNAPAGAMKLQWDGRDTAGHEVAGGVYLYRLRSTNRAETRKLVYLP